MLKLIDHGDGYLGTADLGDPDVAPDAGDFAIDHRSPGNVVSLIDIGEVLQLAVAQMTQSPAKPGKPTFH